MAFGGGNRLWHVLLEHSIIEIWIGAEITRFESVSKRGGRRTIEAGVGVGYKIGMKIMSNDGRG